MGDFATAVVFSIVLLGFGMPVNASGQLRMSNGNLGHSTLSFNIIDKQDGNKINYVCMYATPPDANRQAVIGETSHSRAYAGTVRESLELILPD